MSRIKEDINHAAGIYTTVYSSRDMLGKFFGCPNTRPPEFFSHTLMYYSLVFVVTASRETIRAHPGAQDLRYASWNYALSESHIPKRIYLSVFVCVFVPVSACVILSVYAHDSEDIFIYRVKLGIRKVSNGIHSVLNPAAASVLKNFTRFLYMNTKN